MSFKTPNITKEQLKKSAKLVICYGFFFSLVVNFFLGYMILSDQFEHKLEAQKKQTTQFEYTFLSQRIFAQNQNDLLLNFVPLRQKMKFYTRNMNNIGFYFEYLTTGSSIGINEKQEYISASLLKVPIVMSVYKQIENGTLSKDAELSILQSDIDKNYGNLWQRGIGAKITVGKCIELALIESDNTAKNILLRTLPPKAIEQTFEAIDIPYSYQGSDPVVSAKNYISIFRSLYLSSYLLKDHSNEMLSLLSKSNSTVRLVAGVPENVLVAHKYGVYDEHNPQKSIFSDCGIVYSVRRPYALCMIMRADEQTANTVMKEISQMVYEEVASSNK